MEEGLLVVLVDGLGNLLQLVVLVVEGLLNEHFCYWVQPLLGLLPDSHLLLGPLLDQGLLALLDSLFQLFRDLKSIDEDWILQIVSYLFSRFSRLAPALSFSRGRRKMDRIFLSGGSTISALSPG